MALPAFLAPLVATAVGGLVGKWLGSRGSGKKGGSGGGGKKGSFLQGTPAQVEQLSKLSPELQKQLEGWIQKELQKEPEQLPGLADILRTGKEGFEGIGGMPPEADLSDLDFGPISQKARTRFQEETVPTLAERFTSMGGAGQRSSAFQRQLGSAGAGLEESLAALEAQLKPQYALQKAQYGLQRAGLGLRQGDLALRHALARQAGGRQGLGLVPGLLQAGSYDTMVTPGQPGLLSGLGGGIGSGLGQLGTMFLGSRLGLFT